MKTLKAFSIAMLLIAVGSQLRAQEWTDYVYLQNQLGLSIGVGFRFNALNCDMANGHYRISNESYYDKGYFVIAFKYRDCSGNLQDLYQSENFDQTGVNESSGYWFSTSSDRITDIRLNEAYIPDKKIWLKLVNGVVVDLWKQNYGN